ncbi:MAG: arsenate reductase ArsC [Actinobacteria bacterium]|nr:arsenate reductase ArsC [Actinomycetota bacterium]
MSEKPVVLFVCVHNAGRSQMAAAFLEQLANQRVLVASAGSDPASQLNPAVIAVMAEEGIDLTSRSPVRLDARMVKAADVVVTMGCGDACPIYPSKRYLDWALADPAGQDLASVRVIRDEIKSRVEALLAEITPP